MPVVYICKNCGFELYTFERVGQDYYGLPTPSEIMNWYSGVCPKCNAKLERPTLDRIKVSFRGKLISLKR